MFFSRRLHLHGFLAGFPPLPQVRDTAGSRAGRALLIRLARVCGVGLLFALLAGSVEAAINPVPYIQILSPVSVHPGTTGVTLTVLGAGFVATSVVKWNGIALTTTFVSATKLTAAVPDTLDAAVGLGSITVVNPPSRTSNVVYFPVASAEAGTSFPSTPSSSVSVGGGPTGIVTADFNGDGKLDLAVANATDGTVSILLGNGDGTFTLKSTPSAGSGANWIAVGDFNEDGKLDLAVANMSSTGTAGVSILLGNGDGTFTAGASLTTGNNPFAIVTADFNRDGHLDLAVSNSGDGTVSVFTGSGTGTFTLASTPSVGSNPQVIVTGDFNEDGKLDLAVSNEDDNTVSVLLGNANGTFQAQSVMSSGGTSGFPIGLIAADFNGDGHLDLAAVNASDVGILVGNGSGGFTLASDPTTGSGDLISGVAGDYNGDGKLDIVVSDQAAGEAFLLLGNGNGTFGSAVTFTTAAGAYGVATADFNGDGGLDLAVSNQGAASVSIFLQQLPVSLSPTSLAFGNQNVGSTSSPAKTVTLTNHSGSALHISSIAFTGANNGDFARPGGTCSTSVAVANLATCTMTVNFTPGATGARTGTLTITDDGGNSPQTLGLTGTGVVSAPTISKAFGASTIALEGTTSLSFTITNPVSNSIALTGVAFSDTFPGGLLINTPNGLTGSCGGGTITATAGVGSLSLTGATIAASGSCTFSVNVVGITAGAQANTTGTVSSNESGAGATSNTATVTVIGPPTIAKSFGAASVPLNGTTSLSFTIQNNNTTQSVSGIGFTDTLPSGLAVTTPNGLTGTCGGGTITATGGSGSVSLSGATLAQSSSCTFSVNVTGTAAGAQNNTTGAVTSTNGGTGGTASASLAVVAPPSISKSFGAASIPPSGATSLSFTITNPAANSVSLTGVAFTDTLPANLVVATPNGLTGSCGGGTITATAGAGSASLAGAVLTTNSSCTFAVNVTGTVNGNYTNTTGAVSSTNGGTGNTASANLAISLPPAITSASSTIFTVGTAGSFTVTTTGSPTPALTKTGSLPSGVTFTDNGNGTATLSGTPAAGTGGPYAITITANNGVTPNGTQSFTLTVHQAPAITSGSSTTFVIGTAGSFTVTATGSPTAALSKTGTLPSGVTFSDNGNGTAALSGTPAGGTGGAYPITITAANGVGANATQNFTLTVNQVAAITSANSATFAVGAAGSFSVTTTGVPAPGITKTGSLPSGVNFTDNGNGTATLSGTPAAGMGGAYAITITAANGVGANATQSFTLTVNQAPTVSSANNVSFVFGVPGTFTFTVPGFPFPVISTASPLPNGVTLVDNHNGTATLSGTPLAGSAGVYSVTVTASNGVSPNAMQSFTLTVTQVTPTVTWATPAAIAFGTALGGAQLDATASVAGTFVYSPAAGAVLGAGAQALSVTFTPADSTDYTNATGGVMLTVNKATPILTWATPAAITFGTALGGTQLDATASAAGTFVYTPASGATLAAGAQSLSEIGR